MNPITTLVTIVLAVIGGLLFAAGPRAPASLSAFSP
jgi:hypothetical protein